MGVAVHHYWEPISNWVSGFASGVSEALVGPLEAMRAFSEQVKAWAGEKLLDFAKWIGLDDETVSAIAGRVSGVADTIVQSIKAIPAMIGNFLSEIFTMKDYSSEAEASFKESGRRAGVAFVEAIKNAFNALFEWFKGLPDRIVAAIGKIDLSGIMPDWNSLLPKSIFGSASTPAAPVNDNGSGDPAASVADPASAVAPASTKVGGTVTVKVEGPGTVTSVQSDNPAVPVKATNTGRAIGRN
jgi:hypothetical protein